MLDPVKNIAYEVKLPVRDPKTPSESEARCSRASPYFGDEKIWDAQTSPAQSLLRRESPRLVCRQNTPAGQPGLLQEGLRPSVGEGVSARKFGPPAHHV